MKIGARNQLRGKIAAVKKGDLMAEVKVKISVEAQMESVMTLESLDALGIKEGDEVNVIVKAVNVLLIKD